MPRRSLQRTGRLFRNAPALGRICSFCGQHQLRAFPVNLTALPNFRLVRDPEAVPELWIRRSNKSAKCARWGNAGSCLLRVMVSSAQY